MSRRFQAHVRSDGKCPANKIWPRNRSWEIDGQLLANSKYLQQITRIIGEVDLSRSVLGPLGTHLIIIDTMH